MQKKSNTRKSRIKEKLQERRKRAPSLSRYYDTPAIQQIYQRFIKPYLEKHHILDIDEEQPELYQGVEAFFNVADRRLLWCKANEPFYMLGTLWENQSTPQRLIPGTGRRYVKANEGFVLRLDRDLPDRIEIEFDEQVFVLSQPELAAIQEKFRFVA